MPLASIADLNNADAPSYIEIAKKLSSMYDDLLDNFPSDSHERAPGIHASDINSCVRRSFYCLTEVPRKDHVAKAWQKRFQVGHAVHAMVQEHMARMAAVQNARKQAHDLAQENGWYLTFEREVKVHPALQKLAAYYKFHSSCDGVFTFWDREGGSVILRVGLEIKTESPDSYKDLKSPKDYHVQQMHLYMAALDLPLAWFFYYNKGNQNNTSSEAPWLITFDPRIWGRLEQRAVAALTAETTNTAPEREEGVHCSFCPWSWTCEPKSLNREQTPRSFSSNNTLRRSGI